MQNENYVNFLSAEEKFFSFLFQSHIKKFTNRIRIFITVHHNFINKHQ